MQKQDTQTHIDLLAVIADVKTKKLQASHGIPVELSPLDEIVDGMIGNAQVHLGGESVDNVFAIWHCAQDAVDVYAAPKTNPGARTPSEAEIKLLDRYIFEAKEIPIDTIHRLSRAIEGRDLESTLKIADTFSSREEIDSVAEKYDIAMCDRLKPGNIGGEPVLYRLDLLLEDRLLRTMNADLVGAGCRPATRDNYGDPLQWQPGITVEEIDQLGHSCAEVFIEEEKLTGAAE